MKCTIVLLSWSWCDLCTTMSNAWRTYKEWVACLWFFIVLKSNRSPASRRGAAFLFPSGELPRTWKVTRNRTLFTSTYRKACFQNNLLALCTPAAPPHHCMMLLPSAFGASLPAREQTGNNGAFPVHPVRVVLSGSLWCENWHLVLYVWPLTHRTVNAI